MYRILNPVRSLSSSLMIRLSSSTQIPIRDQFNIDKDGDDEDDVNVLKKNMSPQDYIFADSKSAKFKEKNQRKQKKWNKELEQRQIFPQTPLSSFMKETKPKLEILQEKPVKEPIVRDTYVTPDGTLREDNLTINFDEDPEENEETQEPDEPRPLSVDGNRHPVWYYAGKLKKLASENKVQETLDYFYNEMMDKERVAPNLFCYQVVIGICARNGYLTQAFDLYREMKDRGFTTVDSRKMTKIFTLLATACYRASDSAMAIDRATHFLDEMKEKGFRIEYRTYNSLIAAFGKHRQLKMAFQLADEMTEVGFIPNEDTYASLLIACNGDRKAGFKYAIELWRRMLAFEVQPTAFHFDLLLNVTHQCGLGSPESLQELLSPPRPEHLLIDEGNADEQPQEIVRRGPSFLSALTTNDDSKLISNSNTDDEQQQQLTLAESKPSEISSEWWQDPNDIRQGHLSSDHLRPFSNANILKPSASYEEKNLVALRMPRSPAERLMLLGGIPGVLKHMQECNVLPNTVIFTTLLNLIPSLTEHEQALLQVANMCQVKPNIQFYNTLLLRRLRRRAKTEALQVLDLMREQCLSPDHYTFSALAKGCGNRAEAEQLLNDMNELNLKPNQKILDAMLDNAFARNNFPLLSLICESYRTYDLSVTENSLQRIEKYLIDIRAKILAMEQANVDSDQYRLLSSSYDRFQKFYNKWLPTVAYAKRFDQKVSFVFDKPDLKK